MSDKRWKQVERQLAKEFATQRTALSGSNSKITHSDTLHDSLFFEVKFRKRHAVLQLFEATEILAKKENKIPVVCLKQSKTQGFFILCRLEHLAQLGIIKRTAEVQNNEIVK